MKPRVASTLLVLAVFTACRSSGVPMAPQRSPHFDAVSTRLQLGGTVYAYADIEGDAERATDFALTLLRDLPGLVVERGAHRLNATSLVRILGLDQVLAIGLSSYREGDLFHNRGFIHHTGDREGLLQLLGGEPAGFDVLSMAPEEAGLVWQQRLDLTALVDIVRELGALGVGISPEELDETLSRPALDLDISWNEVVTRLNTTAGMILTVDESRPLRIPGESFWFPYTDFLLWIDGFSEIGEAMARRAARDPLIESETTREWVILRPAIELPPPFDAYQPSVARQIATGRMFVVSSPAFLQRCISTTTGVAKTDGFIRAFSQLPSQGNALMYVSPQMSRQMHAVLDQVVGATGGSVTTSVVRFLLPDAGYPAGWLVENTEDGLLFTSNTASSHKSTLLALGYAALLPAVALAGVSALAPKPAALGSLIP